MKRSGSVKAVEYAEAVQKQNEELKSRLDKLDQSYVGEFGNRIESQVVAAKEAYKKLMTKAMLMRCLKHSRPSAVWLWSSLVMSK